MNISTADARAYLWENGLIGPWYLREDQFGVYEFLHKHRFPLFEASRRYGKTTCDLVCVQEKLRRTELGVWRWCEPWKYQAREIVMPEMDKIQDSCPEHLKFKFYKTDSFYELPTNGARLYLRGVNEDRGESSRGAYAHGITLDEKGSIREPEYVKNEVLLPQLLTTRGVMHELSTPPRNLGHVWYSDKEIAIREGRFLQRLVTDNASLSQEDIDLMCKAVGGVDSPAWRREFLCEPVSDPDMLIVPEYSDTENVVPDDYPRPDFFTPYVGGDSGADDNTALLFGWYDFTKNERVIEEELVLAGRTTKEIVALAKQIEIELWGGTRPRARVYDAPKQLIFDLFGSYEYPVEMPQKDDKIAAIHQLRVEVGARRVKVKARCTNLRRQLRVGMWKDEKHLDFERTEGLGHLDAVAALIYFNRRIDTKFNPIPHGYGLDRERQIVPDKPISDGSTEARLASLFGGRNLRGGSR